MIILPHYFALTPESQKILNNYHNFEQSGSPPATSQPYSPNNSPPEINAVPAPKTNMMSPATTQPSNSPSPNVQSNSPSSNSPPNSPYIWVGIIILIVVFVIVKGTAKRKDGHTIQTTRENIQRRNFSKDVEHRTLLQQGGKCAICGEFSKTWDADHKNGDRSDNSPYNCQMLCPNCHTYKSRKNQMGLD
jgi:hypothetical protein